MKELIKTNFLKSLVYGYALIQAHDEQTKDSKDLYVRQTKEIVKHFSKVKPDKNLKREDIKILIGLQKHVKELDSVYFEDKPFSPYIICIFLLNYLIEEKKDISMRLKFGHFDTKLAIDEVEKLFGKNGTALSHFMYVTKILNLIKE